MKQFISTVRFYLDCTNDEHCIDDRICKDKWCVKPQKVQCGDTSDCPNGEICDNGDCKHSVPEGPCKKDKDCKPPNICKLKPYPPVCYQPEKGKICNFNMECLLIELLSQ